MNMLILYLHEYSFISNDEGTKKMLNVITYILNVKQLQAFGYLNEEGKFIKNFKVDKEKTLLENLFADTYKVVFGKLKDLPKKRKLPEEAKPSKLFTSGRLKVLSGPTRVGKNYVVKIKVLQESTTVEPQRTFKQKKQGKIALLETKRAIEEITNDITDLELTLNDTITVFEEKWNFKINKRGEAEIERGGDIQHSQDRVVDSKLDQEQQELDKINMNLPIEQRPSARKLYNSKKNKEKEGLKALWYKEYTRDVNKVKGIAADISKLQKERADLRKGLKFTDKQSLVRELPLTVPTKKELEKAKTIKDEEEIIMRQFWNRYKKLHSIKGKSK